MSPGHESNPASTRPGRIRLAAAAGMLSVAIAVAGGEMLVRATGREPWSPHGADRSEPMIFEPDPVRGWRHRPGDFVFPPFSKRGKAMRIRLLPDGTRHTGAPPGPGAGEVVLIGGSLTEGFAVSDEETFAWRLQQRFPEHRFRNHGTGGYGTYQALLTLEEILERSPAPRLVLYGYYDGHDIRNVASAEWVRSLAQYARRHAGVAVPYVRIGGDGELVREPPVGYPQWPLRERSALVALLEDAWLRARAYTRTRDRSEIMQRLIVAMRDRCRARDIPFAAAFLLVDPARRAATEQALASAGIPAIDCARPLQPRFRVPGDGHPNARLHSIWADCIAAGITPWLRDGDGER